MYNPQLETFIRVADAGSFNKAAEEAFITPTAVIKQINLLEDSLGVKLFERTHRGLHLTNAQLLMQLWPRIQAHCPDIKFQIIPFENTPENAREILGNLGRNIDVVGGIFDDTMLDLRSCAGLELSREPFCCAVSVHHRLAAKDRLVVEDLYGENLMLMCRGWSHYVDQLRNDILQNHGEIKIVDFEFYDMNVFNRCENSNDVLLAIPGWANIHPLLKVIPVEWEHSIPYGLLHSPKPSETVRNFLKAAQAAAAENPASGILFSD